MTGGLPADPVEGPQLQPVPDQLHHLRGLHADDPADDPVEGPQLQPVPDQILQLQGLHAAGLSYQDQWISWTRRPGTWARQQCQEVYAGLLAHKSAS